MSKQNADTYRRLIRKIVTDINRLAPDADPLLAERLNKKFRKYRDKIEALR